MRFLKESFLTSRCCTTDFLASFQTQLYHITEKLVRTLWITCCIWRAWCSSKDCRPRKAPLHPIFNAPLDSTLEFKQLEKKKNKWYSREGHNPNISECQRPSHIFPTNRYILYPSAKGKTAYILLWKDWERKDLWVIRLDQPLGRTLKHAFIEFKEALYPELKARMTWILERRETGLRLL